MESLHGQCLVDCLYLEGEHICHLVGLHHVELGSFVHFYEGSSEKYISKCFSLHFPNLDFHFQIVELSFRCFLWHIYVCAHDFLLVFVVLF